MSLWDQVPYAKSDCTASASAPLGAILVDSANYVYRYFYNACGASITKSYGFIITTATTGYSVTVTSVTGVGQQCVGVVIHATVPTANYFWGLVKGVVGVEACATGSLTAEAPMALGADGLFVNAVSGITIDTTAIQPLQIVGNIVTGTATDGSCLARINLGW